MPPSRNRGLLITLFLGVLLAALDIAVLGPAMPAFRADFGIGERAGTWALSTWVIFNLLGVPVMTKLSDRHGRRLLYVVDVGLCGLGALVVALAPNFTVLLVGRALQGLGASGIFPVAAAVVGDAFPEERRGRALGVLGAVFGIAFTVGPPLAGILLLFDWRLIYFLQLPLALAVMVLGLRRVPGSSSGERGALDVRGLLALGVTLLAAAYGLNQVDPTNLGASIADPQVWSSALVVALFLPLFIRSEYRAEDPVIRPGLFRSSQVVIACCLAAVAGLHESVFVFLPDLAIRAFEVSKSTASFMLVPLSLSIVVASPIAGRILDKAGSRSVVIGCQAILVSGMAVLAFWGDQMTGFYVGTVLLGLGLAGIMGPALSYILMAAARESERGVSQGLNTLILSIGQLMGSAGIGAVVGSMASAAGYRAGFLAIAVAGVLAWFAAFALKRNG